MIYGYARVSTQKQVHGSSLREQEDALRAAGAQEVYRDSYTGTKIDRPEFSRLLSKLQPGDTLIVTKMYRFARTAAEGSVLVQDLHKKGVVIEILNMGRADNTPMGNLMVTMLLAFAQFERDMIVERTQAGRRSARKRGIMTDGRPTVYSDAQINHAMELLQDHSYTQVSEMTGISKSTLVRAKRRKNG